MSTATPSSVEPPALRDRSGATAPAPVRTIVLVGLMGVGKTTVGRSLAAALSLPFRDSDHEIEQAARCTVAELFSERGEAEFRDGERRVIARLLSDEPPHVLSLGGGAFLSAETRARVRAKAVSVWLKADLELLARRVARKTTRPLLVGKDPLQVLEAQAASRYGAYAEADITVCAEDGSRSATVAAVLAALSAHPLVRTNPLQTP